jgi:diguanylate cyclase (GGDEF)-like protein
MRALLAFLDRRSKAFHIALSFALLALIGVGDTLTPKAVSFSYFYMAPIAILSWYAGRATGLAMALLCSVVWVSSDIYSAGGYVHPALPLWNAAIRLAFYVSMSLLLDALRRSLRHEMELARTDFLTGLANSRSFYEACETEARRSRRYERPMTLVYMDVDGFKSVNDRFGHRGGDTCLRTIAEAIRQSVRQTDVAARWGGDEFVVLLPETNAEQAKTAAQKLQGHLTARMIEYSWPVTFSIGVGTLCHPEGSVQDFIARADALMYLAKRQGKNSVSYAVWDDDDRSALTA